MIRALIHWAERTPDAPAFIEAGGTITYGTLLRGAKAAAAWLHDCGVRAGDTVALSLDPQPAQSARYLALHYALFYLGAPLVPLYPGVPPAQCGPLAARFAARWLIAGNPVVAPAGCIRLDPEDFDPGNERCLTASAPYGYDPSRPMRYEFTSGTTGEARAVLFTGAQYATTVHNNVKCFGWTPGERLLPVALWPGKVGVRASVQIHAAGGALVNLRFPGTRQQLSDLVGTFGVTAVRAVPWQLRQLLASELAPGWEPPPLRFLETGGASIAPQEVRDVRAAFKPNLCITYSCTETGMIGHLRPEDSFDAGLLLTAGMECQAVDDADRVLPAGAVGRLRVRAPWFPSGYVGNPQASAERFRAGWFYPGDIGSIDAAGRVTLHGRSDDTINYGGTKIMPQDAEQALARHPDVADAALVGIPDPLKGQVAVAFLVLRRELSAAATRELCAAMLDASWAPAAVLAVAEIPRNPEGKIVRERLREIFLEVAARRPSGNGRG